VQQSSSSSEKNHSHGEKEFQEAWRRRLSPHLQDLHPTACLEFCIQSWSPHLTKDIETLEIVQRTATRLIPQFRKLRYEERLRKLGLSTLKERRQRGDMIKVFKLLAGVENIDCNQLFTPATTCYALRGHDRKLVKTRSRLDIRKFFFSQRVVNSCPGIVYQPVLSKQHLWCSTPMTDILPEEWTSELQAACPSTYK